MATDGPETNHDLNRQETYGRFMSVTKWVIIGIAVVLIGLALFLA